MLANEILNLSDVMLLNIAMQALQNAKSSESVDDELKISLICISELISRNVVLNIKQ